MNAPAFLFFDEKVRALLASGDLDGAAKLIQQATIDKEFGYGPPLDDLNKARRAWCSKAREIGVVL